MRKLIICIFMVLGGCLLSFAQHPSLLFTQEEVSEIRAGKGMLPEFDKSLSEVLSAADAAVNSSISVPVPIDGGGGAVHEQHKSNYYAMFHCGVAYQLTGDKKYATYVANMLQAYAKLYPTLGFHPCSIRRRECGYRQILWHSSADASSYRGLKYDIKPKKKDKK